MTDQVNATVGDLRAVGVIASALKERSEAPKQGAEGAPDAWIDVLPWAADALRGLRTGDEIIVVTWLHRARRDVLQVHPRSDLRNPLTGVFATRSPDRPNPLGFIRSPCTPSTGPDCASAPSRRSTAHRSSTSSQYSVEDRAVS